jgi:hypothetical protein
MKIFVVLLSIALCSHLKCVHAVQGCRTAGARGAIVHPVTRVPGTRGFWQFYRHWMVTPLDYYVYLPTPPPATQPGFQIFLRPCRNNDVQGHGHTWHIMVLAQIFRAEPRFSMTGKFISLLLYVFLSCMQHSSRGIS